MKEEILTKGMMIIAYDLKSIYKGAMAMEKPCSQMMVINSTCPRTHLIKFFKRTLEEDPNWVSSKQQCSH